MPSPQRNRCNCRPLQHKNAQRHFTFQCTLKMSALHSQRSIRKSSNVGSVLSSNVHADYGGCVLYLAGVVARRRTPDPHTRHCVTSTPPCACVVDCAAAPHSGAHTPAVATASIRSSHRGTTLRVCCASDRAIRCLHPTAIFALSSV